MFCLTQFAFLYRFINICAQKKKLWQSYYLCFISFDRLSYKFLQRTQKDINTQRQKQDQWQQHGKYELFSTDNRHVLGTPDSSLYSKANSSGAGGSVFQGRKVVGGALSNRPVRPSKLRNEHHISQRGSEINPHFVAAGENTSPSLPSSVGTPMRARPRAPIQPPITGIFFIIMDIILGGGGRRLSLLNLTVS